MSDASDFMIENSVLKKYKGSGGEVAVPEGVTSIGDFVFEHCENLTSVIIPEGVTSIGNAAFDSCKNLTSITIPEGVTSIGNSAFEHCKNLTSITILKGVTSIGWSAFSGCENLTSITIPKGVTRIESWAFEHCENLTSVIIPEGVTSIGNAAFDSCKNLTSVTIPEGVTSIENSAFKGCENLTSITIPDGVTSIGDFAFYSCENLTNIMVPKSVTNIGYRAFHGCKHLANADGFFIIRGVLYDYADSGENPVIPKGVTRIENRAFEYCENLTSITIPEGVTSIGDRAFSGCENLTSITIPEGVTSIGNAAFDSCKNLTSITIPEGVTSIGNSAFEHCKNLTSITILKGVTSIGWSAFSGCENLTSITIPKGVTRIESWAFEHCENLTSVIIPEGVTSIGNAAFDSCKNLTSVTIPEGVTSIENSAFKGCENLTSITIPDGVTSIGDFAFYSCENLTNIMVPKSVTNIGYRAFHGCKHLANADGFFIIRGVLYDYADSGENPVIPKGVTRIENRAFEYCENLTSITIPEGVTSIGDYAFEHCENLTSITIPESVTSIGEIFGDHFPDGLRKCSNDLAPRMNAAAVKRYCPHLWKNLNDKNKAMIYLQYQNAAMKKFYKKNIKSTDYNALSKGILQCLGSKLSKKECASLADFMQSYMANLSGDNLKAMYDKIAAQKNGAAVRENLDANVSLMKKIADAASTPAATSKKEGTDYDIAVWNMGFSDDRAEKAYDLDGKIVRTVLQQDLSLLVVDDATGKTSKSIPKRGVSPAAYKVAAEDMRANQKAIRTLLKESKGVLYQSYLSAKAEKSDDWCRLWLGNMVVRRIAAMVVWQQGDSFFTLENENLVQVDGMPYTLTEENIRLAHVMEMPRDMVLDWQKFFTAHQRKQLFPQIWEPCYKREDIASDRYKDYPIHWNYLKYKADLGIDVKSIGYYEDGDYEGELFLGGLEGFSVESQNSGESEVIITSIKPTRWDRRTNAIIAYLDRITMYARIAQDDVTVAQYLPQFTLAQITEFIKFAAENNATSVTALLLEYKNAHFSDFNPMDEFSLEW